MKAYRGGSNTASVSTACSPIRACHETADSISSLRLRQSATRLGRALTGEPGWDVSRDSRAGFHVAIPNQPAISRTDSYGFLGIQGGDFAGHRPGRWQPRRNGVDESPPHNLSGNPSGSGANCRHAVDFARFQGIASCTRRLPLSALAHSGSSSEAAGAQCWPRPSPSSASALSAWRSHSGSPCSPACTRSGPSPADTSIPPSRSGYGPAGAFPAPTSFLTWWLR